MNLHSVANHLSTYKTHNFVKKVFLFCSALGALVWGRVGDATLV